MSTVKINAVQVMDQNNRFRLADETGSFPAGEPGTTYERRDDAIGDALNNILKVGGKYGRHKIVKIEREGLGIRLDLDEVESDDDEPSSFEESYGKSSV